jgi:hypothetical protein
LLCLLEEASEKSVEVSLAVPIQPGVEARGKLRMPGGPQSLVLELRSPVVARPVLAHSVHPDARPYRRTAILYHEKLLISKAAVEELNRLLDPKAESGKAEVEEAPKAKKEAKPKAAKAEGEAAPKKEAKPKAEGDDAPKKEAKPKAVKKEATDNE